MKNNKDNLLSVFIKSGLTILISVLVIFSVVKAGSITPPSGTPSAQFYTLSEIYTRLTTNATATEGGHDFTFADSLAGSHYTLTQIYDAIPTIVANTVKLGTSYLGVAGTLVPSGGDAETGNVLSGKTFFGASQATWDLQTGTMADNGSFSLTCGVSDQSVTAGYYSGGTLTGDADLISANIKSGINIFGVDGDGNIVDTSSGDASAADILSSKVAYVDGSEITGSMTSVGQQTITPTTSNTTITQGYHDGTGYCEGDTDLLATNIMADVDIFGVTGTLLKTLYNGSATSGATDYEFYTQAKGGVDDYNDSQSAYPTGSYQGSWTDCVEGNSYCGTGDSNADAKDNSTGLIWSNKIDSGGDDTQTWFWANNCYEPGTEQNPDGEEGGDPCDANGDDACQCVKITGGGETGCEALGDGNWRLPYQKELMQAYINGSSKDSVSYLSSTNYSYWSSTTKSNYTLYAWYVYLSYGSTHANTKANNTSYRIRCVR